MKKSSPPNMNYAWSEIIIRELVRLGVEHFFIAPGSRSSPLALSAAEYGKHTTVHFDERGLGYAALGHARSTGLPAVVITTSGTAVANLLPAVCEASQDEIPMLLITADRPPELRDTCANQTMNQVNLFGTYSRWFVDMPCPDKKISPGNLLDTIDHAFGRSVSGRPGPVHINQMFREPLAPEKSDDGATRWQNQVSKWFKSTKPFCSVYLAEETLEPDGLLDAADVLARARRGVIVVGSLNDADSVQAALEIARRLKWPVIPDIRSGLRVGKAGNHVIQFADQILLSRKFSNKYKADVILHLGGRVTSKRVQHYIGNCGARVVMVNASPVRMEQGAVPDIRLHAGIRSFVEGLPAFRPGGTQTWLKKWQAANLAAQTTWMSFVKEQTTLTEPNVAANISTLVPDDQALVLASSMPIRDMEMYAIRKKKPVPVVANRGVSGIDGTIATAFGYAAGSKGAVTLVIGDLAMLHDLNSLALIKYSNVPVHLIVINNDGGGIFSMLPIASISVNFEKCFGTAHGVDFADAARMFDLDYAAPATPDDFNRMYKMAAREGTSCVIEVKTDRAENAREHHRLQLKITKAVDLIV